MADDITFNGKKIRIDYDEYGVYSIDSGGWYFYVQDRGRQITIRVYDRGLAPDFLPILDLARWCEEGLQWNA